MKCEKGMHRDSILGCIPNKMRFKEFMDRFYIEPTEIHYDLEMSWNDYEREHPRLSVATAYDRWFKKNKGLIKEKMTEVAKRDYKIKIV